jgi:hypothetical protein
MIDYSNPSGQRDAIVRALMGIANPPPPTSMPGQYGATVAPQGPSVTGPTVPAAGQPDMMGMPPPQQGYAPTGPSPVQSQPLGGGVQGPPAPGAPPQSMPGMPGMGRAGLPSGIMPKTPNLVGQPLPIEQPGSQMLPQQGSQIRGY